MVDLQWDSVVVLPESLDLSGLFRAPGFIVSPGGKRERRKRKRENGRKENGIEKEKQESREKK